MTKQPLMKDLFIDEAPADVPAVPSPILVDGLTPEEIVEIEREARNLVDKENKQRAKDAYKAKALAEARRLANIDPNEEVMWVRLDLPGHAEYIMINGVRYYHGGLYKVQRSLGSFLLEKQQSCWRHENEIGGANRELRNPRNLQISPRDVNIPGQYILNRG
jgi:hypothetical protein